MTSRPTYYVRRLPSGRWEVRNDLGIAVERDTRDEAMRYAREAARINVGGPADRILAELEPEGEG